MLEQILKAQENIKAVRREYTAGRATYDDMKAAAIELIKLRQQVERAKFGRVKSQINAVTVASLLR